MKSPSDPRVVLFVFEWSRPETLRDSLMRIPQSLDARLEEVVIMPESSAEPALPAELGLAPGRRLELRVHRLPGHANYGGMRKAAFEYGLLRGFDLVVTMRGDGSHPPERLPDLLDAAIAEPGSLVLASRRMRHGAAPLSHHIAHTLATATQNRLLGLRLLDYHSSFRVYSAPTLRSIPFQLNSEGRAFDMETVIQCRALGAPIREVRMPPTWREYPSSPHGLREVLRFTAAAVDYRLHQFHVTRNGRYLVDHGELYTLKSSPTGSHMQIVNAIPPGSRVLDLGCSQGLLARPLAQKGARVTGVDAREPGRLAAELDAYFQRDLEQRLELPTGRVFDYVVCSDVIEHLRNRSELLRSVRRYLRPEGRLLISTPNVALWFYRLSLLVGRFEYGARGILDETHVHLYTRATFRRDVEGAGFRVLREQVTALPFELVFESTGRSRLVRSIAHAYHELARLWPSLFAYQSILEAEIITLDDDATSTPGVREGT